MEFKYIRQPEYSLRFRGYRRAHGKTFPVTGFDKECVFAVFDGEIAVFDRSDCEIDQWTGLLDQNKKMVFTNDIVEVRNAAVVRSGCSSCATTAWKDGMSSMA